MNSFWFESQRLGFRRWTDDDKEVFIRIYADPSVMEFFPKTLSREEALARVNLFDKNIEQHGFGLWAAILKESNECIGVIGLKETFLKRYSPLCAGLTWILDKNFWGRGLAKEGAIRCMEWGFNKKGFKKFYAFTSIKNIPSQAVMKSLGMFYSGTFLHPQVEERSLKKHIIYEISKEDFFNKKNP
ncbi:MAG: GNAT family N-acetyltransferase [Brevinema sp.]